MLVLIMVVVLKVVVDPLTGHIEAAHPGARPPHLTARDDALLGRRVSGFGRATHGCVEQLTSRLLHNHRLGGCDSVMVGGWVRDFV